MSIQVNGGASAINWESVLSQIGDVQKTQGADGKDVFTITTNVDGKINTLTVSIPDDLELPAQVDAGALEALVTKLESSGLGFTPEQIAQMKDAIVKMYNEVEGAYRDVKTEGANANFNSVLYDIYALMALMIEVAQSQRDAAREMRTAQNLSVQASFQAQADQQRQAAYAGMIAGIVCGAAGAAVSIGLLAAQGISARQQTKIMQESGADASSMRSTMLNNSDNPEAATAQLNKTQQKVGEVVASKVNADFETQMNNGKGGNLEANLDSALQARDAAKLDVAGKEQKLSAANELLSAKQGEKNIAQNELDAANNTVSEKQTAYNNLLENKENTPDYQQRVDNAKAELETAKAKQGEAQAKFDAADKALSDQHDVVQKFQGDLNLANEKLANCESDLTIAKNNYTKTATDIAAQYEERYQKAVDGRRNPPEGMTKAQIEEKITNARNEMEMAFAKEAKLLSKDGALSPSEHKDIMTSARTASKNAMHDVYQRADFRAAESKMSRLLAWNGVSQAFFQTFNSVGQSISSLISAEATMQQGETQKEQEMLDQTKDLFQQEQKLIDQVVQLCQAVIQAESQSMRDAIQA